MAAERQAATGSVIASGDRSVAIGGDVTNGVIFTGDVTFVLTGGAPGGTLIDPAAVAPVARPRPTPLHPGVARFPLHVDRQAEIAALHAARVAVNVVGEHGIGKTYVLCHLAHELPPSDLADGVVFVLAHGLLQDDLLQVIYDEFYEYDPPAAVSSTRMRRDLAARRGLVILDDPDPGLEEMQALVASLPACRIVIATAERTLWDGAALALAGLPVDDGVTLIAQALGRPLGAEEIPSARRLCELLQGHPLRIRQAAAQMEQGALSLDALVERLAAPDPPAALAQGLLAGLSVDELAIVAVLAVVNTLHTDRLAEITGALPGALDRLEGAHIIQRHSPRYSLTGDLGQRLPKSVVEEWSKRLAAYLTEWAQRERTQPGVVLEESGAAVEVVRRTAVSSPRQAVALARAVAPALVWGRRLAAWREVAELTLKAAALCRDEDAEAWALHELGTHSYCADRTPEALAQLRQAATIRRRISDSRGEAATRYNLGRIGRPPSWWSTASHGPLLWTIVALVILVFAAGLAYATRGDGPGDGQGDASSSHRRGLHFVVVKVVGAGKGEVAGGKQKIHCTTTCHASFRRKHVIWLRAFPHGSTFTGWGGGCSGTGEPCKLRLDAKTTTVTARFTEQTQTQGAGSSTVTVTTSLNGTVTGTVEWAGQTCSHQTKCRHTVPNGHMIKLVATHGPGSVFSRWSGDETCAQSGRICTLTVGQTETITAEFVQATVTTYQLTIGLPRDGGSVTSSAGAIDCPTACSDTYAANTTVTLTANADKSVYQPSWTGCDSTLTPDTCTVKMTTARNVTVIFVLPSTTT